MSFLMTMDLSTANCSDKLGNIENAKTSFELVSNQPSKEELSMGACDDQERAPLLKSITELQTLSSVMYTFHDRWNELQKHLEFIDNAIQNREKQLATPLPSLQPPNSGTIKTSNRESPSLTSKKACRFNLPGLEKQESERKSPSSLVSGNASESELEALCRNMCCRALRKHIVAHLSQTSKLRHEVPTALKSAANPAKLVLECVGKFYLQGRKAFAKNSGMIPSRQAAILILEYFLLMDCSNQTDHLVKKEAEQAALAWRKRLIVEGGILGACDEDARGLLLLVACFGVPNAFTNDDLIHLIQLSSANELSEALRKSTFLLAKMPEIIECMTRKGMEVEAVDTIYIFAIEDKFPPQKVLAPFLRNLKKARKKTSDDPISEIAINQKQLDAFKSLQNCLKVHKIEPTKIIPNWKLNEKITKLEKEITELNEKISSKRKAEEQSFEVSNDQEFKRPRAVLGEASIRTDSPFSSLHEPRVYDDQLVYQLHSSKYPGHSVNQAPPESSSWPQAYIGRMGNHVGFPGSFYTIPSATIPSSATPIYSSERSMDRNFATGPTEMGVRQYRGASSSLVEGFPGSVRNSNTPSVAAATSRSSASDLYHFADRLEGDYARPSYEPRASYQSSFHY